MNGREKSLLILVLRRAQRKQEIRRNGIPDPEMGKLPQEAFRVPDPDRELLLREGFRCMGWPAYDACRIGRTAAGKPYVMGTDYSPASAARGTAEAGLPGSAGAGYEFNYSDSRSYCVAAFGGTPVGIDVEEDRRVSLRLLRRLPEGEQKYICGSSLPESADGEYAFRDCTLPMRLRFAQIWTAKEAFGKMTGSGLTQEILETDFSQAVIRISAASQPIPEGTLQAAGSILKADIVCLPVTICGVDCMMGRMCAEEPIITVCTKSTQNGDRYSLSPQRSDRVTGQYSAPLSDREK